MSSKSLEAPTQGVSHCRSMDKVKKRASNVQKLAEENEKLKEQLREMSDRSVILAQ